MEDAFDQCITGRSTSRDIRRVVKSLFWISANLGRVRPQGEVERQGLKLRYILNELDRLEELTMFWPPDLCYLNDIAVATSTS